MIVADALRMAPAIGSLAMGCEQMGGTDWGRVDLSETRRAVRCALDLGVKVFDTADVYGLGQSERELGRALGKDRHSAVIVTKFGIRWRRKPKGERALTFRDASPNYVTRALEGSLRRLRVEAIPVYLVHWPDPAVRLEDTLGALEAEREKGKVVAYGLSNFDVEQIAHATRSFPVGAVECPFSLIQHTLGEAICRAVRPAGLMTLTYGVLGQGLLTGKYQVRSRFDESDRRSRLPQFADDQWPKYKNLLSSLKRASIERGKSMAQVAIRWVLDSGLVNCAIIGAKTPEQVEGAVGALGWALTQEEWMGLRVAATADG